MRLRLGSRVSGEGEQILEQINRSMNASQEWGFGPSWITKEASVRALLDETH